MFRIIGTIILIAGVVATLYGALAFFVVNDLPPNNQIEGRLPSLYILFAGMATMLLGATVKGMGRVKPRV